MLPQCYPNYKELPTADVVLASGTSTMGPLQQTTRYRADRVLADPVGAGFTGSKLAKASSESSAASRIAQVMGSFFGRAVDSRPGTCGLALSCAEHASAMICYPRRYPNHGSTRSV